MMKDMNLYTWIAVILVLVGGINWGLVGLFNVNIISAILGEMLSRLVFIVVGVGAGYIIYLIYKDKMKKT
jgi:hypothetical protein